jgi:chemotaxis methyl-accepting protein methylase
VAILLDEIVKASKRPVPARIFATDLSEADLAIARLGVYDTKAVGNIRMRHLAGCFSRHGDSYAIAPRLRENVDFSAHNLLDGETTSPPVSIYGDFDLVFCSNVLIYYQSDAQYFILDKLWRCLAPGGHLITGETEKQIVAGTAGFHTVAPPAAIFQKKGR